MVEIPDDVPCPCTGYFATGSLAKTGFLSHSEAAGAGVWRAIIGDSWTMDKVERQTAYPGPWSEGWKEWRIPVGWGDAGHNLRGQITPNPTSQRFTIDPNGTSTISKYGHTIERRTDNKVYLDGALEN